MHSSKGSSKDINKSSAKLFKCETVRKNIGFKNLMLPCWKFKSLTWVRTRRTNPGLKLDMTLKSLKWKKRQRRLNQKRVLYPLSRHYWQTLSNIWTRAQTIFIASYCIQYQYICKYIFNISALLLRFLEVLIRSDQCQGRNSPILKVCNFRVQTMT